MERELRYCPACAGPLELRELSDQGRHPACTRCGFILWQNLKPCVDALIVRGAGRDAEVLLGRRAIEPSKRLWDTPGGFLNVADTPEDRLMRACSAEMGIRVSVEELLGAFTDRFAGVPIVTLYYRCKPERGQPRPGEVVDQVRWFPVSQPPPLAFPAVEQALRVLRERLESH